MWVATSVALLLPVGTRGSLYIATTLTSPAGEMVGLTTSARGCRQFAMTLPKRILKMSVTITCRPGTSLFRTNHSLVNRRTIDCLNIVPGANLAQRRVARAVHHPRGVGPVSICSCCASIRCIKLGSQQAEGWQQSFRECTLPSECYLLLTIMRQTKGHCAHPRLCAGAFKAKSQRVQSSECRFPPQYAFAS